MINLVLWVVGAALLGVAIWRIRAPLGRMNELDRLAQNAARYDSWRGGSRRTAAEAGERTGADEMREMMRRQVLIWAAVGIVGVLAIFAGFAVR